MILVRDNFKCNRLWQPYVFTLQRYWVLDVQRVSQCEHKADISNLDSYGKYCCYCWPGCSVDALMGDLNL
jgi:hypothetical protein